MDRSAADWMARRSGTTTGRARAALEASRRLAELGETDQALAKGELSSPQAEAITDAATADPSSEPRLLSTAKRRGLRELREDCARTKARAEDAAERANRLHRQRCLRTWKGTDGSWNLSVRNTPEAGADIEASLAPLRDQIFNIARLAGRSEPTEAYAADALSELVRLGASAQDDQRGEAPGGGTGSGDGDGSVSGGGGAPGASTGTGAVPGDPAGAVDGDGGAGCAHDPDHGVADEAPGDGHGDSGTSDDIVAESGAHHAASQGSGGEGPDEVERAGSKGAESRWTRRSRRPDTKVIVLIDYEALRRGHAESGETCEIAGVGPISVRSARSLMADAFGAAVVTNGVDVFTVAHLGRSATAHQRSALEARGYRCEVPGCGATRALELDHIDDWHLTWRTQLDRLAWLCRAHHQDKTHRGWRLEGPPGDRQWTTAASPASARGPDPPATAEQGEGAPTLFGDPAA